MKLVEIPALIFLPLCLATALIFRIFSLLASASQLHSLLGSTYELIIKAKSSPAFVFFVFNVIVVAVLPRSSKASNGEFDWFVFLPPSLREVEEEKGYVTEDDDDEEEEEEEEDYDYHGYDGYDEDNDDEGSDDDIDWDDEGDDDLNRRIEDFIAKINREWREEWFRENLCSS